MELQSPLAYRAMRFAGARKFCKQNGAATSTVHKRRAALVKCEARVTTLHA
jgi:hypothetical protein